MKTEVEVERELLGGIVRQKTKSEMMSASDLVILGNKWRSANGMTSFNLSQWLKAKSTNEFIEELKNKYGEVIKITRGRNGATWMHPLLFIDLALAISPKLKIEVYEWLFDNLIKYRNDSGDSYKEMSASLFTRCSNHKKFPDIIQNVAIKIKSACLVKSWNEATQEQLKKRDNIHMTIKLYARVLTDIDEIVRLSIIEGSKL